MTRSWNGSLEFGFLPSLRLCLFFNKDTLTRSFRCPLLIVSFDRPCVVLPLASSPSPVEQTEFIQSAAVTAPVIQSHCLGGFLFLFFYFCSPYRDIEFWLPKHVLRCFHFSWNVDACAMSVTFSKRLLLPKYGLFSASEVVGT